MLNLQMNIGTQYKYLNVIYSPVTRRHILYNSPQHTATHSLVLLHLYIFQCRIIQGQTTLVAFNITIFYSDVQCKYYVRIL
jgi:hypothetical protein